MGLQVNKFIKNEQTVFFVRVSRAGIHYKTGLNTWQRWCGYGIECSRFIHCFLFSSTKRRSAALFLESNFSVMNFESVNEILLCDLSSESRGVLSRGAVYYRVQGLWVIF